MTFAVTRSGSYAKSAFPTAYVYAPTAGRELRLVTCGGSSTGRPGPIDRTSSPGTWTVGNEATGRRVHADAVAHRVAASRQPSSLDAGLHAVGERPAYPLQLGQHLVQLAHVEPTGGLERLVEETEGLLRGPDRFRTFA